MKLDFTDLLSPGVENLDTPSAVEQPKEEKPKKTPFNIAYMDVDAFIKNRHLKPVTSHSVFYPSTTDFHPEGLFSEEIFGQIGTPERFTRHGYIVLNTKVLHPLTYLNITKMKRVYESIMMGKTYAVFNEEVKDFEKCDEDTPGANTGFLFFMSRFLDIDFKSTGSIKRENKIKQIKEYKDKLFIDKILVTPAGTRDVRQTDDQVSSEEINKIYSAILALSMGMPKQMSKDPNYDSIRFNIQQKVVEVYLYLENLLLGNKKSFLPGKMMARTVALGTRNVITAANLEAADPDDPSYLKHDESLIPLYQTAKAYQHHAIHQIRVSFFEEIFSVGAGQAAVIDPKTFKLVYEEIPEKEKNVYWTPDGLEDLITRYANNENRFDSVSVRNSAGKEFYFFLVYDTGEDIYLLRNLEEFKDLLGDKFDMQYIRPLTMTELMYIATFAVTNDKYVYITRYPVLNMESTYPSRIHLGSTTPSRVVTFRAQTDDTVFITLPAYPIINGEHLDSTVAHPTKLKGLDGDYDGDTVSVNFVWSEDANEQIRASFQEPSSMVDTNGNLIDGAKTDLIDWTIYNFTA